MALDFEAAETGTLETPEDAGKGESGVVKRWLQEIALADKEESNWRKAGDKVIERYRDDEDRKEAQFNILYANTQTLSPALYSQTPTPDVRRRFRDADPIGKVVAEVLERSVSFTLDHYDFDAAMHAAVMDRLLPGRAVTRVRYEPSFRTVPAPLVEGAGVESVLPEDGTPPAATDEASNAGVDSYDEVAFEAVYCEQVQWKDFRRGPGRNWSEVQWIGFIHHPTKAECEEWFKEKGEKVALDHSEDASEAGDSKPDADTFKRGTVYEIWDKAERKVIWISPSVKDEVLREDEDPLGLRHFFPIPRPLYAVDSPDSLIPIEEYRLYKDQAEELDRITKRIAKLIEVLKVRGVADGRIAELWNLPTAQDGDFVPAENISQYLGNGSGSLANSIWMWPIETIIAVLQQLYIAREQIKATIYEITGISDILRGNTEASETATAQSIKAQWGSLRLRWAQKEVQRYARDLIRIMAEIIAEKFQPNTLMAMTGMQVDEQVLQVLRSDAMRSYRVDIETDSTIQADEQADKEAVTQLLTGITSYLAAMGPAVQAGYIPAEAAKAILLASVRRFRLGRDVEAALDTIGQQDPNAQAQQQQAAQAQQQAEQQKQAIEVQKVQAQGQAAMTKAQADMQRAQSDIQIAEREHTLRMEELTMQAQFAREKHQMDMAKLQAEIMRPKNEPDQVYSR